MNALMNIVYLGHDEEFLSKVQVYYYKQETSLSIHHLVYKAGCIAELDEHHDFSIVLIDISDLLVDVDIFLEELRIVKNYPSKKDILFVALVAEDEAHLVDLLIASGVQFVFFKGCDVKVLLRDIKYIRTGKDGKIAECPTARNIMSRFESEHVSIITSISKQGMSIESDYAPHEQDLYFKIPSSLELENAQFKIKKIGHSSSDFPMTSSYELTVPSAQSWERSSRGRMPLEELKSWLGTTMGNAEPEKNQLMIVSKNLHLLRDLVNCHDTIPFKICFKDNQLSEEASTRVRFFRPRLMFIDFDQGPDGEIGVTTLMEFIRGLRLIHQNPFIVVSNCPSSSTAMQKISNYSSIVATSEKLNLEILLGISTLFYQKDHIEDNAEPRISFRPSDPRKIIRIPHELKLVELSEHKITFTSKVEVPYFSVISCLLPVEFYVLTIPTSRSVGTIGNEFCYEGIIHGITEGQLSYLRQFIDHVIYEPPFDYSAETLTDIKINIYRKNDLKKDLINIVQKVSPDKNFPEQSAVQDYKKTMSHKY